MSVSKDAVTSIIFDFALTFYNFIGLGHAKSQGHAIGRSLLSVLKEEGLKVQEFDSMAKDLKELLVDKYKVLSDLQVTKKDEYTVVVEAKGCFMLSVEKKLKEVGAEVFACPITSMVMAAVEELFDIGTEYREFFISDDSCKITFGICK
ncbi:MAG: hypothetical protein ACFFCW_09245 [Candidatus Hodarchaeota archaeon]